MFLGKRHLNLLILRDFISFIKFKEIVLQTIMLGFFL